MNRLKKTFVATLGIAIAVVIARLLVPIAIEHHDPPAPTVAVSIDVQTVAPPHSCYRCGALVELTDEMIEGPEQTVEPRPANANDQQINADGESEQMGVCDINSSDIDARSHSSEREWIVWGKVPVR